MTTPERIALILDPATGDWKRPDCECQYHFWDGKPIQVPIPEQEQVAGFGDVFIGHVAPHIHLCPKHTAT